MSQSTSSCQPTNDKNTNSAPHPRAASESNEHSDIVRYCVFVFVAVMITTPANQRQAEEEAQAQAQVS
jgi:hypothetical protein